MFKSIIAATAIAIALASTTAIAQTNAFTYQGTLNDAGTPANGLYDIQFRLYNDILLDNPENLLATFNALNISVTDGLFSAEVDFGNNVYSTTANRFIELRVRPAGTPTLTTLTPRKQINTVPYAIRSQFADFATSASTVDFPISESIDASGPLLRLVNNHPSGMGIIGQGTNRGLSGIGGIPDAGTPSVQAQTGVSGFSNIVGVQGSSLAGTGVVGASATGIGVVGTSATGTGGRFESASASNFASALLGIFDATIPGTFSAAVRGQHKGTGALGVGVYGSHDGAGWGIYGTSASGFAGFFDGDVHTAGTLSKSGGSFKIDHPQDPENMYLSHSFVESPDMKNIYDGVIILNQFGQATITLPSYFNALNQTFRYQLTTIGGYAPVYIAAEIESSPDANSFAIAGGTPNLKVSWQVTGIRQDAWANQNRIPIEEYKEPQNKGKYLNPAAFNQPKEKGIGHIQSP